MDFLDSKLIEEFPFLSTILMEYPFQQHVDYSRNNDNHDHANRVKLEEQELPHYPNHNGFSHPHLNYTSQPVPASSYNYSHDHRHAYSCGLKGPLLPDFDSPTSKVFHGIHRSSFAFSRYHAFSNTLSVNQKQPLLRSLGNNNIDHSMAGGHLNYVCEATTAVGREIVNAVSPCLSSTAVVDQEKGRSFVQQRKGNKSAQMRLNHLIKGQWTPQEDRLLVELVNVYGTKKWSNIASKLQGRVGKQCRDRWHNHLRPDIRKDAWSLKEEEILVEAHKELGNKWSEIAKKLPGRTENTVKNQWNATKRRQLSNSRRKSTGRERNSFKKPRMSTPLELYINSLIFSSPSSSFNQALIPEIGESNTAATALAADEEHENTENLNYRRKCNDNEMSVKEDSLKKEPEVDSKELDLFEMFSKSSVYDGDH